MNIMGRLLCFVFWSVSITVYKGFKAGLVARLLAFLPTWHVYCSVTAALVEGFSHLVVWLLP